jgi:hypothetical protein
LRHKSQSFLISERVNGKSSDDDSNNQGVIVFNTLPWARSEVIVSPVKSTEWSKQQWKDEYEYLLGK